MKPLLLLTAVALSAQTGITIDQQKAPPASAYRLIVVAPDGTYRQVELGTGLAIVDGKIIATVALSGIPRSQRLTATNGTYAIPVWAFTITRNGLMMEEGEDFVLTGSVLTPKGVWAATDFVVARGTMAIPVVQAVKP